MLYITEYLIIHLRCLTSVLNSNNKCYVIYNSRYIHSNVIKYLHTVNGYLYLYLYPGDKKGKPFLIRDISNSQDTVQLLYLPPYLLTYKNTSTLKFTPIRKFFPVINTCLYLHLGHLSQQKCHRHVISLYTVQV